MSCIGNYITRIERMELVLSLRGYLKGLVQSQKSSRLAELLAGTSKVSGQIATQTESISAISTFKTAF